MRSAKADSGGKVPTNVRLSPTVYSKLKELVEETRMPAALIIEHLIEGAEADQLPKFKRTHEVTYVPVEK